MKLLFDNALLLDPELVAPRHGSLRVREGTIEAVGEVDVNSCDYERIDLAGAALAPGFLDLHYHGRFVFGADDAIDDALVEAASLTRHGTTGYLATSVAWTRDALPSRVAALSAGLERAPVEGAQPLGLHLEGPWIAPEAAGAQPAAGIHPCTGLEAESALDAGAGRVRMVTLAPEIEGADALLDLLARRDVIAALGHSRATAAQARRAVGRGARHVTHLFNAMGPLHHREPGLVGTALADERLTADLICDGAHVHPDVVRSASRALAERLVLITDRVDPPAEAASFGSGALHDDGIALRTSDGRLAGSRLTLDLAVRNLQAFAAVPALEAVAACTLRPAQLLGIEAERGTLRPGARADLVVLDAGHVHETWIAGRRVHRTPDRGGRSARSL